MTGHALVGGGVPVPSAAGVRSSLVPVRPTPTAGPRTATNRASRIAGKHLGAARALLDRQVAAVRHRDRGAYLATIDPRATAFAKVAARTFDNLVLMDVSDFHFGSPVVDEGALTPARRRALGPSAWVAEVDVTFVIPGGDRQPWTSALRMAFVEQAGRTYLAGDQEGQASSAPVPLWLAAKVSVVRGTHSLLIGAVPQSRLRQYAGTADRAVPRVTAVWGSDWAQYVVVIVPGTQQQMERAVGVGARSQGAVAAVTTSVGRANPARGSHIVVNPETFDKVGSLGRLVVLTHEITHVAAHATVSTMPVWLSEGFADYVGFHDSGLPPTVVAQEFLEHVRRSGAPAALPGAAEFDPQAKQLDEAYESAWLACRYIARTWSEETLVEFYKAMDLATAKTDEARVYDSVLGTTPTAFAAGWRRYVMDTSTQE